MPRRRPSTTNATMPDDPARHAFCLYAFSAIRPCASVSARMKQVAASVSRNMSRWPRSHLLGEQLLADPRADQRRGDRPGRRTARPRRRPGARMPMRKSSCLPSLARPASFGSSAACTAWNSSSGIAGDEQAGDEARGEVLLAVGVASRLTPNTLAYESSCARTDPTSSHAERARQLRVRRVRARACRRPRCPRSEIATAISGGATSANAVEPGRLDADRRTGRRTTTMRTVPSDPCMSPYGAEAAVARQRAAGDERDVVDRRSRRTGRSAARSGRRRGWSTIGWYAISGADDDDRARASPPRNAARLHERAAAYRPGRAGRRPRGRPLARAAGRGRA